MKKFKSFLFNLLIKSGFLGGVGVFVVGMTVMIACMFCVGLVTYYLCGFDFAKECSKFEKILANGIFVTVFLAALAMAITIIYNLVKTIKNSWEDA